jgi:hypothetical protein
MEKHFLDDMMEGTAAFEAKPWYNPHGDCIVYELANEAVVAERVDELLTVYNSANDDRPIGFQIKGVGAIVKKLGLDGLAVQSEADADGICVKSISIVALLLAAYEEGPRTLGRRKAYAAAMECPANTRTIRADELQPA